MWASLAAVVDAVESSHYSLPNDVGRVTREEGAGSNENSLNSIWRNSRYDRSHRLIVKKRCIVPSKYTLHLMHPTILI